MSQASDALKAAGFKLGGITNQVARYTEPLLKGINRGESGNITGIGHHHLLRTVGR